MDQSRLQQFCRNMPENAIRLLLESNENVQDTLSIVAPDQVRHLDFSQLERINTTFVPKNLRKLEADLLYSVPYRTADNSDDQRILVYLLIEHQSDPERLIMFRLLEYMLAIWRFQLDDHRSNKPATGPFLFQPILPIVFYTGTKTWNTITPMAELVRLGERFPTFIPSFAPLFLNVQDVSVEQLTRRGGWFGQVLRFVRLRDANIDELENVLHDVVTELESMPRSEFQRWKDYLYYLFCLIYHYRKKDEVPLLHKTIQDAAKKPENHSETLTMGQSYAQTLIQEGFDLGHQKGHQEGHQEGRQEGRQEGELTAQRAYLVLAIQERFGDVPQDVLTRINETNESQTLTNWMREVMKSSAIEQLSIVY